MNETIKILILEDDAEEREQFEQCTKDRKDASIIGCTADAEDALKIAQKENPDAIIIDLELHNGSGNGLQFLSDLGKLPLKNPPYLLVTTNNSSRTTHEAARALGADFILTKYEKDYSASYVVDFLKMMHTTIHAAAQSKAESTPVLPKITPSKESVRKDNEDYISVYDVPESDLMKFIREELIQIGISPKAVGFQYLADAVLIKLKDSNTNLYTILGPKYKKSDPSIERAMQYSINRAWRTGDPYELLTLYTARINSERGVPTIMEFVYFFVSKAQNHFKIK